MNLPNVERAIIEPAKLRDYLLSREHPVGRFKVRFFESMGFTRSRWELLESALRGQHLGGDASPTTASEYGQKYEIRAILVGPDGRAAPVVSVWIVRRDEDVPRFVTAYPGGVA